VKKKQTKEETVNCHKLSCENMSDKGNTLLGFSSYFDRFSGL
jgi:hypothetical protein